MNKEHKKMYKAGKNWVTAMVTIAAVALFTNVTTSVHADTVVNNTNNAPTTEKVEDTQSYTEAARQSTTANTDSNQNTANTNANSNTSTDSSSNTQPQVASNGNQWTHFNGGWSYTDNQGNWVYNQWQRINNNWYYFNNGGYAQTGWFHSGAGNWYYFDNNNAWADTGWQYINNNWYYFDKDNAWALTGWQKLNNKWYYFDNNNAWALTGWQKLNNKWYYFDNNNAWALTDWQRINNNWYYFDKDNAWALTGWQKLNNKWYYFDPNNAWMLTGSQHINGATEYFLPSGEWENKDNALTGMNIRLNNDYASALKDWINGKLTDEQLLKDSRFINGCIEMDKVTNSNYISNNADRNKTIPWEQAMPDANQYFLALLNPIRVQLGLTPLTTNSAVQSLAKTYGNAMKEMMDKGTTIDPLGQDWYSQNHIAETNGFDVQFGFGDQNLYYGENSILYGDVHEAHADELHRNGGQFPVKNIPDGMLNIDNMHHYLWNYFMQSMFSGAFTDDNGTVHTSLLNIGMLKPLLNINQFPQDYGPQINGHDNLSVGFHIDRDGLFYIFTRNGSSTSSAR